MKDYKLYQSSQYELRRTRRIKDIGEIELFEHDFADRARYLRMIRREEQEIMSRAMSDIVEHFVNDKKIEAAKRILEKGKLTTERISKYLDLPSSVVKDLENDM